MACWCTYPMQRRTTSGRGGPALASSPSSRRARTASATASRTSKATVGCSWREADAFNRQHAKHKLTARERISRLVDRNSFEEIDIFATHRAYGFGLESKRVPGDGVVTGMAKIDGRDVVLFSHDASVFGGSLGEVFAEKVIKVMDLALRNRIPIIGINDSGGA